MTQSGRIRVGIGGWDYDPWRQTFFPPDVPKKKQLEYASRQLTAIEVNGTFYRLQTPAVFAKWRDETPEDFVFSIKAPRYIVQRKVLAEAGPAIERFLGSGLRELGAKLGPILWQMQPRHPFAADDLERFFEFLPPKLDGLPLRHAIEAHDRSFVCAEFVALARRHNVAIVHVDSESRPPLADVTGAFVYARLRRAHADVPTGYPESMLQVWAQSARTWARGGVPDEAPLLDPSTFLPPAPRDVFVYFINGAKERAPAAAQRLLAILRG